MESTGTVGRSPAAFIFLALFLGTAPSRVDGQWLESKGAHYTVFYQAGFEMVLLFQGIEWMGVSLR